MTPADYSCVTLSALVIHIMYFFHYALGPTCRGSASLYVPPLNYKRDGTQRYKGQAQLDSDKLTRSDILSINCLGPLLILGLGRVHSATRPVDFPTDIWRAK
jgi:hypothetical protein